MKKMIIIMVVLALITVACVTALVMVLVNRSNEPTPELTPDYAPREEEPNAEKIPNDSGDKLQSPEGGGAASIIYSTSVTVDLSDNKAELLFGNPQKSNQDIVLQIVVKGQVIVQSGRLVPGNRVKSLGLLADAPVLGAGIYSNENCKFVVLYYDRESGEKSILNTEIPVTVTVRD